MSLDQNPHQTVTGFGCVGFSMYACGFSVPQMRQVCLFTYPPRSKWASSEKMIFFFAKIGIFCKSIASPIPSVNTNYLSNQTCAKYYHSRNKHQFEKKIVRWRTLQFLTTLVLCALIFTHYLCGTYSLKCRLRTTELFVKNLFQRSELLPEIY